MFKKDLPSTRGMAREMVLVGFAAVVTPFFTLGGAFVAVSLGVAPLLAVGLSLMMTPFVFQVVLLTVMGGNKR